MSTVPDVDYRATSNRPAWVGADVTSGFTGSYAGSVRCTDGSRAFVKAAGPDLPFVVAALSQEATVLGILPPGIPAPSLIGSAEAQGWSILVLGVIEGTMPGQPWTAAEIDAVHKACLTVVELTTPCPDELRWPSVGEGMAKDAKVLDVGRAMAAERFELPLGMPAWVLGRQREITTLTLGAEDHLVGNTLCHGDIRPDNLLVDASAKAWVVDWNWVGAGPAWVDLVGLLPMMSWQGNDVDELLATSPLTREADPEGIDGFVAVIAAYMMSGLDAEPPPGCTPALRQHQRLMAHMFLEFLRRRRGWHP